MKKSLFLVFALFLATYGQSQKSRNLNGKSRKDFFGGARDVRNITKNGLQITFGPNYTFTKLKNTTYDFTDETNRPMSGEIDPAGRIGGFIDIGMAHYRLKESRLLVALGNKNKEGFIAKRVKSNLFHRCDWGLGFNYLGGKETTTVLNQTTNASQDYVSKFYNGYLTGRFTADRFTLLSDNWHLETGLGANFNYNILKGDQNSFAGNSNVGIKYQRNFMAQLHAHLAFDYRIRKGDYLSFGFYIPFAGLYEMNKLKPTIQWYSSNYWPAMLQVKWIHHFTKKSKGCNTGSPEDKKRNEEYMQNR
jgi:hypothetical protein